MTPKAMKEIVDHMKARASQLTQFPQGFNLVDDQGRVIGAWYSIITARTFVQMRKDGIVRIDTPISTPTISSSVTGIMEKIKRGLRADGAGGPGASGWVR